MASDKTDRSPEERLSEFIVYMRKLPKTLPENETTRLITIVEETLGIQDILKGTGLNFYNLNNDNEGKLLSRISNNLGQSLSVLTPPLVNCLLCHRKLGLNHTTQTQVALFTLQGPKICSKYIYRCKKCPLREKCEAIPDNERQDVFYHPEKYGNMKAGWMFYNQDIDYIRASGEVYLEKSLVEYFAANLHHGWTSSEAQAEAYNEAHRESQSVKDFKKFINKNPSVGNHFNKEEDLDVVLESEQFSDANKRTKENVMHELGRKSISAALYNFWIKSELKRRKMSFQFGPYKCSDGVISTYSQTVESLLVQFEEQRGKEVYPHLNCSGMSCALCIGACI